MTGPFRLPGAAPEKLLARRLAQGFLPRGYIDGLTLSNDTTDAVNDIAVAPGACRSTVNVVDGEASTLSKDQVDLEIPVSIIKRIDGAWEPANYDPAGFSGGGRSAGRSPSALSSATWHAYAIGAARQRTDILFHDSATEQASIIAALPQNYTAYRRIGAVIRVSGTILAFTQFNDEFLLSDPPLDYNNAALGTTSDNAELTVPAGIKVTAILNARVAHASAARLIYISSVDTNNELPSASAAPLATVGTGASGDEAFAGGFRVRTNAAKIVTVRANGASTSAQIVTLGWIDQRGRN